MTPEQQHRRVQEVVRRLMGTSIKDILRNGGIHCFPRQSGKTTAIVELAQEFRERNKSVALICPNAMLANYADRMWRNKFYGGKPTDGRTRRPLITSLPNFVSHCEIILVDEFSLCRNLAGHYVLNMIFAGTDTLR